MFQTLVEVTEIKKISNLKGGSGYHLYIFKKKKIHRGKQLLLNGCQKLFFLA